MRRAPFGASELTYRLHYTYFKHDEVVAVTRNHMPYTNVRDAVERTLKRLSGMSTGDCIHFAHSDMPHGLARYGEWELDDLSPRNTRKLRIEVRLQPRDDTES